MTTHTDRPWASGLAASFLGAQPDMPDWRIAELASRKRILPTWLSEIEVGGGVLEPGPAEYLARARRRVATLHALGADLTAEHGVNVVKGWVIARHMPTGVLRHSGDVDLVASDEESLWRVVLDVRERYDAVVRGLSVLRATDGDRQLGVWLRWPAEEPLLDRPMGLDVTTCTLAGDLKKVPLRTAELGDADLLSLFAVAEERFHRKFRVKDLIDLVVLVPVLIGKYGDGVVDTVAGWAAELCLAPELLKLSRRVYDWRDLPDEWLRLMDRLTQLSDVEVRARAAGGRMMHTVRYGLMLDDEPAGRMRLSLHSTSDGELAATPAGTFLLVDSGTIDEATYRRALAAARKLHTPD